MGISIKTNVISLAAQRSLNRSQGAMNDNIARLASGLRINRAADAPAGLAVSEQMLADVRSLNQAHRNANDAISLLQSAEGAMDEIGDILVRMRELGVEAANDTLTNSERTFLNDEFTQLKNEIDRISEVTEFNGRSLIDGTHSSSSLQFQVGIDNGGNYQINVTLANVGTESIGSSSTNVSSVSVSTKTNAQSALSVIDAAITDLNTQRSRVGSFQSRLTTAASNLMVASENSSAAVSRIRDVDVASETANFTRNQILVQAGAAVLAQANSSPSVALSLIG